MIVATAGHIDHGKTALVKALTGIDADRLPEERARGITLDLGFAHARRGGAILGFVDVPGHERLVRTMVAGATGVGCALLVVAADDGVMPQTREHAAILDLLGLDRGVVAITKSDRADAARLAAVAGEVGALMAGTGLAGAPVVPCSALTGAGIDAVAGHLDALAAAPERGGEGRDGEGRDGGGRGFRLAVDRCFTVAGAGLVVTGAVHAGTVRAGDRLLVSPGGREVRVRAVHRHDAAVESAGPGARCALNLAGPRLSRGDVHRGDWILSPGLHGPAGRLDVRLRLLPGEARALRHRTAVQVHLAAAAATGRVLLPGSGALEPGGVTLARIALDAPLGALFGDRLVLRDASAARTLGGGRVIDVDGPRRGPFAPARLALLAALDAPDDAAALGAVLDADGAGLDLDRFARLRNLPPGGADALAVALGAVVAAGSGVRLAFAGARVAALRERVLALLDAAHVARPDDPGLDPDEIAALLSAAERPALRAALDGLLDGGEAARWGGLIRRAGHVPRLRPADAALWDAVRGALEEAGLDQPRLALLAERLGREPEALRPLLDRLGRIGALRRLSGAYYLLPEAVAELARRAEAVAAEHPEGLLTVGRFREAAGIGRHLTMPLLEHFDAAGFTLRIEAGRRIRGDRRAVFEAGPPA